jgi:hypothetical protein
MEPPCTRVVEGSVLLLLASTASAADWWPPLGPFPDSELAEWRPCAVAESFDGEPRQVHSYAWTKEGQLLSQVRTTAAGKWLDETKWKWGPSEATSVWHACRFGQPCREERRETRWTLDAEGRPIAREDYEVVRAGISEDSRTLTVTRTAWDGRVVDRETWVLDRRGRPRHGLRDDAGDGAVLAGGLEGHKKLDSRGRPAPGEVEIRYRWTSRGLRVERSLAWIGDQGRSVTRWRRDRVGRPLVEVMRSAPGEPDQRGWRVRGRVYELRTEWIRDRDGRLVAWQQSDGTRLDWRYDCE